MVAVLAFSDTSKGYVETEGVAVRKSGSSEGTGSEQEILHGIGSTPKRVLVFATEDPAGTTISIRTVDTTKIYVTVTSGKGFAWIAETW